MNRSEIKDQLEEVGDEEANKHLDEKKVLKEEREKPENQENEEKSEETLEEVAAETEVIALD